MNLRKTLSLFLCLFTLLLLSAQPVNAVTVKSVDISTVEVTTDSSTSLTVTWDKVTGVSGYRIYRRSPKGTFSLIGTTTDTYYTDKKLPYGTPYFYTIQSYKKVKGKIYTSTFDKTGVKGATSLPAPSLTSVTSPNYHSVTIKWGNIKKATGYAIMRKTNNGTYKQIAVVVGNSKSSYTDTTAISGTAYRYSVRAFRTVNGVRYFGYRKAGLSISTRPSRVYMDTVTSEDMTSIQISWKQSINATGYELFRKTDSGDFVLLTTIDDPSILSYTDTDVVPGGSYTYTVKAYASNGTTTYSLYNKNGIKYTLTPEQPALPTTAVSSSTSIQVSFTSVKGATGYGIYRKSATESWTLIGTVTDGSFTYEDSNLTIGRTYYYSIAAYVENDGQKFYSTYDTTGTSCYTLPDQPVLSKVSYYNYITMKVAWTPVTGAAGYLIYRQDDYGNWQLLDTVTDGTTSLYYDRTCTTGQQYTYSVASYVNTDGAQINSTYDTIGLYGTPRPATPVLLSCQYSDSASVTLDWKSVAGASGYRVYRKVMGGSWVIVGTVTDPSIRTFCDTKATTGTTYYYSVAAYYTSDSNVKTWGYKNSTGRWVRGCLGIDVSKWQSTIDWQKVADSGVEFAIIKCLGGSTVDKYFPENMLGAKNAGLKVGVYVYDTASTNTKVLAEANQAIELLADYDLDLPVFFDYEEKTVITSSKTTNTNRVKLFCNTLIEAGYESGIYTSANTYVNKLNYTSLSSDYNIWVANYHSNNSDKTTSYKKWGSSSGYDFGSVYMWQYTSKGSVKGISGNVDLDVWYTCQ